MCLRYGGDLVERWILRPTTNQSPDPEAGVQEVFYHIPDCQSSHRKLRRWVILDWPSVPLHSAATLCEGS
ncbi:hypothetical protein EI94DRAFT_1733092, partial [Lactarius quietus]